MEQYDSFTNLCASDFTNGEVSDAEAAQFGKNLSRFLTELTPAQESAEHAMQWFYDHCGDTTECPFTSEFSEEWISILVSRYKKERQP